MSGGRGEQSYSSRVTGVEREGHEERTPGRKQLVSYGLIMAGKVIDHKH